MTGINQDDLRCPWKYKGWYCMTWTACLGIILIIIILTGTKRSLGLEMYYRNELIWNRISSSVSSLRTKPKRAYQTKSNENVTKPNSANPSGLREALRFQRVLWRGRNPHLNKRLPSGNSWDGPTSCNAIPYITYGASRGDKSTYFRTLSKRRRGSWPQICNAVSLRKELLTELTKINSNWSVKVS